MSRSGLSEDDGSDTWGFIRWRGAVSAALGGRRGQAFLRELLQAMEAMPERILASESLQVADGEYCTLGVVGAARGIDLNSLDNWDRDAIANALGIAEAMAAEVMYENDEGGYFNETPARRWERMYAWAKASLLTVHDHQATYRALGRWSRQS